METYRIVGRKDARDCLARAMEDCTPHVPVIHGASLKQIVNMDLLQMGGRAREGLENSCVVYTCQPYTVKAVALYYRCGLIKIKMENKINLTCRG